MALVNILIVFLGLMATSLSCQLPSVCDEQCTALEANITTLRESLGTTYRLQYHVEPPAGWMNDPNGFIYYKGNYHIFYQYNPLSPEGAGKKHWGHSTSPDLVNWDTQLTALIPGEEQCFSGSAVIHDTTLVLVYTGRIDLANEAYEESQYLAFSDDGIHFHKYASNPVLRTRNASPDFRDPKVWRHGDYWYVIIGSRTTEGKGSVLLYRSPDLINWTYLNVLAQSSNITASAYMWECPDFFELNGKYVIMMSPQGMNASGDRYQNLYQTGYILGSFSYDTYEFVTEVDFQEIDYGHDFYATQSIEKDGKRLFIAWFGMWETIFPEKGEGWAGALTIFRELELSGNRILMKPVEEMTSLRVNGTVHNATLAAAGSVNLEQTAEIIVTADWTAAVNLAFSGRTDGGQSISLKWDITTKKVIVDRGGIIRQKEWTPSATSQWRIFLDTSSVELFCGDGEVVFSSRAYPLGGWKVTNAAETPVTNVLIYKLNRSVPT